MRRLNFTSSKALVATGLIAGLAALPACNNREISEVVPNQDKEEFKDIPVELNRDIDILFMIDNSGSMEEEQQSLSTNFPQFINVLQTIEGGLPNVHIGVVSSDVGAGPYNISNCSGNGDNGQLQTQARVAGCTPPTGAYISDVSDGAGGRTTNYTGSLADVFSCIAELGTNGCGFEQHLESVRRALNGSNAFNNGFLRPNAYLAVILIADEDDCSTRDTQMFDTSQNSTSDPLGPLASFRCFEFGVDCTTGNADPRAPGPRSGCFPRENSQYMYGVQEYVDFLKGLKSDPNLIIVGEIVGNPEPVTVGVDPERPQNPALVPSCQSAAGKADPAVRMKFLGDQFPNRNAFTTICNEDLTDGLVLIAQLLKEAIGNPCIEGDLVDKDPNTAGVQPDCVVSDVLNPNTAEQVETALPQCNQAEDNDVNNPPNSTNLPCWHLEIDTDACPETSSNLTLLVERGGASVPTGTHVQAHCVVN
ncbi:MAG: VWA domain-containing protein [Kofleriaceae bacterium]|nr:VWA domain-containing protein [Kofleriaceae bacterium]